MGCMAWCSWEKKLGETSNGASLGGGFKYFFYVHPYLGKWSILTNIFQMGWNHQPVHLTVVFLCSPEFFFRGNTWAYFFQEPHPKKRVRDKNSHKMWWSYKDNQIISKTHSCFCCHFMIDPDRFLVDVFQSMRCVLLKNSRRNWKRPWGKTTRLFRRWVGEKVQVKTPLGWW